MTTPQTTDYEKFLPKGYVLKGAGANVNATVVQGRGRSSSSINLPLGDNIVRFTFHTYRGRVAALGVNNGNNRPLFNAQDVPPNGVITVAVPNADPQAWFGVRFMENGETRSG